MWRGHCYGVDLIPGPGISAGHEYSRKKKKYQVVWPILQASYQQDLNMVKSITLKKNDLNLATAERERVH